MDALIFGAMQARGGSSSHGYARDRYPERGRYPAPAPAPSSSSYARDSYPAPSSSVCFQLLVSSTFHLRDPTNS